MTTLAKKTGPLTGRVVSRYRVGELLGEGGMGTVYRGEDLRLGRPVALKFLRDGGREEGGSVERLRREARAASILNHPHICTVHDVELMGDRPFLVMELLEGSSLAARLSDGPLPLCEVLELGGQLADALADAHDKGVVHRDLKPANVILTGDGRAKIVDFGIAGRRWEASGLTTSVRGLQAALIEGVELPTTTGLAGTLPYMAPEQAQGRRTDARSDLFSLGAVLYEMATGRRAFGGSSTREILDAVGVSTPPPPSRVEHGLPRELDGVILKALEKSPARRHQSAEEIRADLQRLKEHVITRPRRRPSWLRVLTGRKPRDTMVKVVTPRWLAGGCSAIEPPPRVRASVAVVPVRALACESEGHLLADAMTDALVARLSQNATIRVVSVTSMMGYKDTTTSTPQIARDLGVDVLVEGCLLLSGGRVRITTRVVEAATDRCVWSRMREGERGEVLALQDELSREAARDIAVVPGVPWSREASALGLPALGA